MSNLTKQELEFVVNSQEEEIAELNRCLEEVQYCLEEGQRAFTKQRTFQQQIFKEFQKVLDKVNLIDNLNHDLHAKLAEQTRNTITFVSAN